MDYVFSLSSCIVQDFSHLMNDLSSSGAMPDERSSYPSQRSRDAPGIFTFDNDVAGLTTDPAELHEKSSQWLKRPASWYFLCDHVAKRIVIQPLLDRFVPIIIIDKALVGSSSQTQSHLMIGCSCFQSHWKTLAKLPYVEYLAFLLQFSPLKSRLFSTWLQWLEKN